MTVLKTKYGKREAIRIGCAVIHAMWVICFLSVDASSLFAREKWTGRTIMDEVLLRHDLHPYVFEEQTMILTDSEGNHDVRKVRRYSRIEKNRTVKFLLIFDHPAEIRGAALLAVRQPSGKVRNWIYLPALGRMLETDTGDSGGRHFLGTDFTVEDVTAEVLSDYRYRRTEDTAIEKKACYVVEAFPVSAKVERMTGYLMRRHFIQKDNFFIVRTDYYDRRGRYFKSLTRHDLRRIDARMWRADMILMENHKEAHRTLIKINRCIFSHDYVPAEMFTPGWLLKNRHIQDDDRRIFLPDDSNGPQQ